MVYFMLSLPCRWCRHTHVSRAALQKAQKEVSFEKLDHLQNQVSLWCCISLVGCITVYLTATMTSGRASDNVMKLSGAYPDGRLL
jgi:hypothetical protein